MQSCRDEKAGRTTDAAALADLIDRRRADIELLWLARVEADIDTKGTSSALLRDGMPDYLAALVRLLRAPEAPGTAAEAWTEVARKHGVTRVRIGFDIGQLLREFICLRHVIREVASSESVPMNDTGVILADVLDGAITTAVAAYVSARDYEVRRQQAESIGFLTHELRNPLSTAISAGNALEARKTQEQSRLFDILRRSLRKLESLVDGVLFSQKLEAGQMEPHPADVTLGTLMEPALESARAAAAAKGLSFAVEFDGNAPVHVDPVLTRSAIENLADNATKYTDQGNVAISVELSDEDVVVHVDDTGPGIPPEEVDAIFEPFRRGSSSAKKGTGLGLAIARRAAEAQGGSLSVAALNSHGAHFRLTLPRHVADPP
jgi:signal transduction histidine kinase